MNEYNPQKIEEKWQRKWEQEQIFQSNPEDKEKFYITVPYPYTSGPLHIGHGRTYTLGDIYARFKRKQGYNVLWPMAFHMTGTPVLSISQQIKEDNKEKINLFKDYLKLYEDDEEEIKKIIESFKDPYNVAKYFANVISKDFKSIGYSIDWRRQFTTGDEEYQKFVEWQFQKYKEKGYLEQGSYPILYCLNCENAVGEDDIQDGDRIKPEVETLTGIKYPYKDGYLVASTLRPETIFGITNIFINPNATYVKAKVNEETWYVSKKAIEKLKKQSKNTKILKEIKGKKFIGKKFKHPIKDEKLPIIKGEFVDPDNATGVVYSVPAHAPYDYIALKDSENLEKIEMKSIINTPEYGKYPAKEEIEKLEIQNQKEKEKLEKATEQLYKKEFHQGKMKVKHEKFKEMKVKKAKEQVGKWLKEQNKATEIYEATSKENKVRCRCGGKVIATIMEDQWFLNYNNPEWEKKAKKCLNSMEIKPDTYRESFENTFEWLDKRPCARKRGIGTEFPFQKGWIIESLSDSTIYMAFYTIKHLLNQFKINKNQLTHQFWDYLLLDKGKPENIEEETNIPKKHLKKMKKEFQYWYPNDQRHTAIAHLSNHLSFFIFAHAGIFPEEKWPKTITLNELIIKEGKKMSKSKGNVIPLAKISEEYSADLFRIYIGSAADIGTVLDWREEEVQNMNKKLNRFHEVISKTNKGKEKPKKKDILDEWISSKINNEIKKGKKSMKNYKVRNYIQHVFTNTISALNKYKSKKDNINQPLINKLTDKILKANSPIIPHLCEELWHQKGHKTFISKEKWPKTPEKSIKKEKERMVKFVDQVAKDIREIKEITNIDKPKKIKIFIAPEWKRKAHKIATETEGKIIKEIMQKDEIKKHGKKAAKYGKHLQKNQYELKKEILTTKQEEKALKDLKKYLENQFQSNITIQKSTESSENKADKATPMKPAILIE